MILHSKINRSFLVILILTLSVAILTKCMPGQEKNKIARKQTGYSDFAGSASCMSCHKNIYDSHLQTGHHLSADATRGDDIKGSFEEGHNTFAFNTMEKIAMEKREDGYYQVLYVNGTEMRKSRFDITVGSGKKGQSYLSWRNNSLIQMPVTYFAPETTWSSSPGFNPQKAVFNRVVTTRCLECHSTYFQKTSDSSRHPEEFDKKNIIYQIDCEKCHGPGKEHVSFHTNNPGEKQSKFIVNTGKLDRQKNLDMCTLCHGGKLNKTKPSFSFQAGDDLSDFFEKPGSPFQAYGLDVHGNQYGALSQSKCFTASDMSCLSCHNVHEKEQGKTAVFSQRCMNCHAEGKSRLCGLAKTEGAIINTNCIDCHMPLQLSQSIAVYLEGATVPTPAKLRTHFVKVYNEETDKVLKYLNNIKGK